MDSGLRWAKMRWIVLPSAIIAGAVDVLYVSVILQGATHGRTLRAPYVATFIAAMAMAAALSVRPSASRWQVFLLSVSAIGLLAMGFIAIFSIGLALLAAGALGAIGLIGALIASRQPWGLLQAIAGGVTALLIFFGGFELTERVITCPAKGYASGGGAGFLSGPYHYTCVNGTLTLRPGMCTHGGASMDTSGRVTAVSDC